MGLLTYIIKGCGHLRRVKLSLLANDVQQETGKQPKLLLNFSEIGVLFWSPPISVLKEVGDYPEYTSICGPDFHLVADRARCFVKGLRSLGIEPVFFVNVTLEDDDVLTLSKGQRAKELLDNYLIQQVLERSTAQPLPHDKCNDLVYRQILYSLREEGAEMVFCAHQSSVHTMARYAQMHRDTCGIVSNNPDFAVMSGCVLFPLAKFDCENLTGLKKGVSVDEKPGEIVSMAISSTALAESLEIREDQLPDLAILCGRGVSGPFIHRLSVLTALGVEGTDVENIAEWLNGIDGPLMASQVMRELCLQHPDFSKAVESFYSAIALKETSPVNPLSPASPVYDFVEKEMLGNCKIIFAAAKRGSVWLKSPCENLNLGQPSIMGKLGPVRKTMYTLLGMKEVCEYGRFTKRIISVCMGQEDVEASIKCFDSLRALDKHDRLVAVYRLTTTPSMKCVEDVRYVAGQIPKESLEFPNIEWPKLHKLAILCCSLRLMVRLNKSSSSSLAITNGELDALLLSSLTCATEGTILPHIVHVLPSMKALSVSEWFCSAVDIVYEMSCLLGVTEASPEPRNVFYPMAFIPYHLALESHPNLTERQKTDIEYVKTAMQTALSFPSVSEFRSCIFNTDERQALPTLIAQCNTALEEVLKNAEQLLPRTMTASVEELNNLDEGEEGSTEEQGAGDSAAAAQSEVEDEKLKPPAAWGRDDLPIMEHCEAILELIASHQVVCIEGETGCGKSSQVPQFILKHFHNSRVLVSQPNYLAAKKLAERVRIELLNSTMVTHCDELHTDTGNARLIYGTNVFIMQALLEQEGVCSYTHIILDEIHERTTDIDFGMFLARQLAKKLPELKIILMSATLQGKLFVEYFRQALGSGQVADPYFVGIRRFPVHVFYIDELSELVSKKNDAVQDDAMKELVRLQSKLQSDSTILAHSAEVSRFAQDVCINLILSQPEPGDSILVFLPGLADMVDLHAALLRQLNRFGVRQRFKIFIFHNQVPIEEEKEAFEKPRDGQANIIISHSLAESSITFPHLKLVINFAIRRYMIYDPEKRMSTLTRQWCSKASCTQREGRVGRVSEGTAVHLIMKEDYKKLADFQLPGIVCTPLAKTVLKAKQIIQKGCDVALPSQLLGSLIEPPSLLQFDTALHDLVEIGAVLHDPQDSSRLEEAEITLLGEFSLGLPLDLKLCRLILLGILFGCPLDAVVIAASFSMYQDVFNLPTRLVMDDMKKFCESLTRSTFSRLKFDSGCYSKPIMVRNMFLEWIRFVNSFSNALRTDRRDIANQFAWKCSVRVTRLLHFETSVSDIAQAAARWLPPGTKARTELMALSNINKGRPPYPVLTGNTYFTENLETSQSAPSLSLRPNSTTYVPLHLRNLSYQRSLGTKHQLHFCNDNVLLKALITAASPNEIMCGQRCSDSSNPDRRTFARRCVKISKEEGFYPAETLTMDLSMVSDVDLWAEQLEKTDENAIRELYESFPREFRFPVKVRVDKETNTAVLNFYSSVEANNSVVKIARDMGYVFGKSPVDHSTAELSKISPELHVLWRLGECRLVWEVDGVNALFPWLNHPSKLYWEMMDEKRRPVNSVRLNFRNPTGLMCLFKPPLYPYLAVSTGCFLNEVGIVMATEITLLPPPPQSLMMILAFQLPTSVTELLIDRREGKVKGLRLNHNEISCKNIHHYISKERLEAINRLRHSLSTALSASLVNKQIVLGTLGLNTLWENLAAILTPHDGTTAGSDSTSPSVPLPEAQEASKDILDAHTDSLMWEMITPGKLLESDTALDQFYYPELKCSLLGSEPYAVAPARCEQSTLSIVPTSIEYKETVATKLLLENFDCVESSEESDGEQFYGTETPTFSETGWIINQNTAKQKKKYLKENKKASSEDSEVEGEKSGATSPQEEEATPAPSVHKGSQASVSQKSTAPCSSLSFAEQIALKLEQEIVRHLQRNNKMEFLSELRVQRRIKHICSLIRITLNVPFFLQRPNVFQVREVEEGGEGLDAAVEDREYLIVLDRSKWRDVDSDEEESVLPPSMRIIRKSRRIVAGPPMHSETRSTVGVAGIDVPKVTEGTQTEEQTLAPGTKPRTDSVRDKPENKEVKSSPSKPLTATKAVKLPETKVSNTPRVSIITEDKRKTEVAKKLEPVASKPVNSAKISSSSDVVEQAKPLPKEPAKKTAATAPKKRGPLPGTNDHLALYLYDYIVDHGGEVRLAALRKEAFPEYYDRYPNWRYSGYRYLRKAFLLDYPQYFKVLDDQKILYVRAVEEKQEPTSHKQSDKANGSNPTTHDTKQEKKTSKPAQGKESPNSVKKTTESQQSAHHSTRPSSALETHVETDKKPRTDKTGKVVYVPTVTTELVPKPLRSPDDIVQGSKPDAVVKERPLHSSKDVVQGSKSDAAVHFVQVPSSSRLSQEPVAVSELEADSIIPQSTPSHDLSQLRSHTHTRDQQAITQLLSLADTPGSTALPQVQPAPNQMVHVTTLESTPPPLTVAATTAPAPVAQEFPLQPQVNPAVVSAATSQPQFPSGGVSGVPVAFPRPPASVPALAHATAVAPTLSRPPQVMTVAHAHTTAVIPPTVTQSNTVTPTVTHPPQASTAKAQSQAAGTEENEEEWHSSEESWLSEDEFDGAQDSSEHLARYLHNYLHNHSFQFGCTVSELDKFYQNDYKKKFHSKKVASITVEFLRSHSKLFKVREEIFLKLREGVDHAEANSFRGRPYTPEHINDYYSRYLGKEGGVCSLSEAQHVFETVYRKDYKMPVNPLIWFVGDSFFRRSFHQFVVFTDHVVFKAEGKH